MKECLSNIVGLSRTECDCYEISGPLKSSSLNLYVDELEGIDLVLIKNALRCGEELEENFRTLFKNAVNFFESDLQVAIAENYKQKYNPFVGRIGEYKYSGLAPLHTMVGIKLDTKHVNGAAIIINSISLFFSNTGTIKLLVYKNDEKLDEEYEIEISSEKTTHALPSPLMLPIVENGIKNNYYFVYNTNGLKPYNNSTSCSCEGIEQSRGKFLNVKGVYGTNIDNLNTNSYAHGLSLNATISCSIGNLICGFMLDDTFNRRAGLALWYKLGVLIIGKLFSSREINYDTMSDREYLYGRRNHFDKQYRNIILWLSENTTINDSECFICNSTKVLSMGKNLI